MYYKKNLKKEGGDKTKRIIENFLTCYNYFQEGKLMYKQMSKYKPTPMTVYRPKNINQQEFEF